MRMPINQNISNAITESDRSLSLHPVRIPISLLFKINSDLLKIVFKLFFYNIKQQNVTVRSYAEVVLILFLSEAFSVGS